MTALAPGLSLALVPSLLWVLAEPDRPAGAAARPGLPRAGAGRRCGCGWTAPLVLGATVGALLVLRLAAPYVGDAVPRWVLIGGAGAAADRRRRDLGAPARRRPAPGRLRPRAALSRDRPDARTAPELTARGPSPRPLPVPLATPANAPTDRPKACGARRTDLGSQSSSPRRCSGTIPVSRSRTSDSR